MDIPTVDKADIATCPHCGYVHGDDEGWSEMLEDGTCIIGCARCRGQYQYKEDK